MKKTQFTNKDGECVEYEVPDEVADHIDILWVIIEGYNILNLREVLMSDFRIWKLKMRLKWDGFMWTLYRKFSRSYKRLRKLQDDLIKGE